MVVFIETFLRIMALVMAVFGIVILIEMTIDRIIAVWVGVPMCIIIIFAICVLGGMI